MEKFFLPLIIAIFLLSTVTVAAVGQDFLNSHDEKICVESRSCAINYMNNLDKEKE